MEAPLLPELPGYDNPQLIAHGTSALVFRATQTRLNRLVAIKVITVDTGSASVNAGRELATTVALSSQPHIVSIIDTGTTSDDRPYIVMEYCEGGSYAQILRRGGPLPVADVIEVGIKIGEALHAAHHAGIVHRDVKPSNILRSRFGPALADFGIARAPDELSGTLTREMMTPHHASPEALLHQAQSGLSDVYSLASTLWTLLIGHPPLVDPTRPAVDMYLFRDRVLNDPVPPMERTDVPAWLVAELRRAMAKLPADRHASAAAFAEALRRGALGLAPAQGSSPTRVVASRPVIPVGSARGTPPTPIDPSAAVRHEPTPPPAGQDPAARHESTPPVPRPADGVPAWLGQPSSPSAAPPPLPAAPPGSSVDQGAWAARVAPPVRFTPAAVPMPPPSPPLTSAVPPAPEPDVDEGGWLPPSQRLPLTRPASPTRPEPLNLPPTPPPPPPLAAPAQPSRTGPPAARMVPPTPTSAAALAESFMPAVLPPPIPPPSLDALPEPPDSDGPVPRRTAPARPGPQDWAGPVLTMSVSAPPAHPTRRFPEAELRGRNGPRLGIVVGLGIATLLAVAAGAVITLLANRAHTASQPRPTASAPLPSVTASIGGPPRNVRLTDRGTAITLTWVDPSGGQASFLLGGTAPDGRPLPAENMPQGKTTYTYRDLKPNGKYCVVVGALYGVNDVQAAEQVCTHRS